jgi:opacity protein-like surface antigen
MKHFIYKNICTKTMIIVACAMLVVPAVHAQDWSANVHGLIGNKNLDEDDWGKFDNQVELGASFDFKMNDWPLSITAGTLFSVDAKDNGSSAFDESGVTIETHLGIRKIFDIGNSPVKPYVGGGLALVFADLERRRAGSSFFTETDDDEAAGFWIGTGIYWTIINKLNIGFDIRYSEAEVTLFNNDVEAGGLHTVMTFGYHW